MTFEGRERYNSASRDCGERLKHGIPTDPRSLAWVNDAAAGSYDFQLAPGCYSVQALVETNLMFNMESK